MVVVVNVFNPSGSRWISTIEANQDYIVKTVSKKKKGKDPLKEERILYDIQVLT